jgi:NDP-sugar pyrophosphorylase family protein
MLMAAGLGTRLRPFTDVMSKVLLPVMGVPCAQFAIDAALAAGVTTLVANVHHHPEKTREGLGALDLGDAKLVISDESARILGSAGGIAHAVSHFEGEPFFLLNADVLCDVDLARLARRHTLLRARHGVSMTLAVFSEPAREGAYREIRIDESSGLISGFGEVTKGRPYFVGAAVMEPEAVRGLSPDQPAEFVPQILEPAIRNRKAGFFLTQGNWFDVGSPALWCETHLELMKLLEHGQLSKSWRRRIESVSVRVGSEMWIGKKARRWFATADWQSPGYYDDLQDSTSKPPREFGPRAVLYGQPGSRPGRYSDRISYRGISAAV